MTPYEIPACAGKPYRPSNGTEGDGFRAGFCDRCAKDDGETPFNEPGACSILGAVFHLDADDPEYPAEWTHDERGRPTCTAFVPLEEEP